VRDHGLPHLLCVLGVDAEDDGAARPIAEDLAEVASCGVSAAQE
jgi:hypothetical protein